MGKTTKNNKDRWTGNPMDGEVLKYISSKKATVFKKISSSGQK